MKVYIRSSERWDGSWSKRYDELGDYTYYVTSSPKGSARVNCFPGKFTAIVKIRETGKTYPYVTTKSEFDAMDWATNILWSKEEIESSTKIIADTARGYFDCNDVKAFLKEKLASKIDPIITFTDGGFYDLEKQGISGIGIYVGYQHKGAASSKAREKVLRNSMYHVENAFAEYLENEGIDPDSMEVDNYLNSMDMFRIWAPADPEDIDASTKIQASADILPFKEIQKGMNWNKDWHSFTVTGIAPSRKTCTIVEEWIAEDSGRECSNTEQYMIKDDGEGEYVTLPGYEDHWRLYAVGADNFPLEEMMRQSENDDAELYGENPYSDEDLYDDNYRSSSAGDYGPSNPWDAPGMSMSDFI